MKCYSSLSMAVNENQGGKSLQVSPSFLLIFSSKWLRGEEWHRREKKIEKQKKGADWKECERNDPESGDLSQLIRLY